MVATLTKEGELVRRAGREMLGLEPEDPKSEQAHIVLKPPDETDETVHAYVMRARVEGFPVTALCGYTWVPHKSAEGLPVCEECREIYRHDPHGKGRDDIPKE